MYKQRDRTVRTETQFERHTERWPIERDKEIKRAHLTINRAIKREVLKKMLDF